MKSYARHQTKIVKIQKSTPMHIDMDKLAPFLTDQEEAQMKLELQEAPSTKSEAEPAKIKAKAQAKAKAATKKVIPRKRWTPEEKNAVLRRLAAKPKNQTRLDFCRSEKISSSMLANWQKDAGKFASKAKAGSAYVLPAPVKPDKNGHYPEPYKVLVAKAHLAGAPVGLLARKLNLQVPTIYKWAQVEKRRRDPHAVAQEFKAAEAKTKAAAGVKPTKGSLRQQVERSRIALITAIAALAIRSGVLGPEFTGMLESLE
jgi:hypothetical protein